MTQGRLRQSTSALVIAESAVKRSDHEEQQMQFVRSFLKVYSIPETGCRLFS